MVFLVQIPSHDPFVDITVPRTSCRHRLGISSQNGFPVELLRTTGSWQIAEKKSFPKFYKKLPFDAKKVITVSNKKVCLREEAYRPPCSKSLVGGTYLRWCTHLGGRDTYLDWGTYLDGGVPTLTGGTYLEWGVPTFARRGYLPWLGGTYFGWGTPPGYGQTDICENSTFPHPSDAGGNKSYKIKVQNILNVSAWITKVQRMPKIIFYPISAVDVIIWSQIMWPLSTYQDIR